MRRASPPPTLDDSLPIEYGLAESTEEHRKSSRREAHRDLRGTANSPSPRSIPGISGSAVDTATTLCYTNRAPLLTGQTMDQTEL